MAPDEILSRHFDRRARRGSRRRDPAVRRRSAHEPAREGLFGEDPTAPRALVGRLGDEGRRNAEGAAEGRGPEEGAAEKEEKIPVPKKPETKKEGEKAKDPPPAPEEKPIDVGVAADQGTGIAVDAPVFPFSYYLAAIERKVSANWFSAVSEGASGITCVVYFRLRRDGSVDDAKIETSSGNAYFDRAALRAVKSSSPFPPLPRAFPDQYLGIHFTFVQKE